MNTQVSNLTEDVLAWRLFLKGAQKRKFKMPTKSTLDNRLIISTDNFFIIAGFGAFIPGYVLVITKNLYTSFAQLTDKEMEEYSWLVDAIKQSIKKNYDSDTVLFEHGMCSCAGGLDHAHVHMMPIPNKFDKNEINQILNKILKKRAAGINKIEFNNNTLDNIHDISTIINFSENFKITDGRLLKSEDLNNFSLDFEKIRKKLLLQEQYIYFKILSNSFGFCTKHHLGTQFGREIIYEIFFQHNNQYKNNFNELNRSNPTKLVWRWQDYMFEKNILITMKDLSDYLKNNNISKKFKLKIFVK